LKTMSGKIRSVARTLAVLFLVFAGCWPAIAQPGSNPATKTVPPQASEPKWLVEAQWALGLREYDGHGGVIMFSNTIEWLRMEADHGNPKAQYSLGSCYQSGRIAPKDEAEALKWKRRAAENGDAEAQWDVGSAYRFGEGVKQDDAEAFKWHLKAARQGHVVAQYWVGKLYATGTGVARNERQAVRWYRAAAKQRNVEAQDELGVCYEYGRGAPMNYSRAFNLYLQSADLGGGGGRATNLCGFYARHNGGPIEPVDVARWYRSGAEAGRSEPQFFLALCYECGFGVTNNYPEAMRWYREAANQGHAQAQVNFGKFFERGGDVEQNRDEAVKWYRKAAALGNEEGRQRVKLDYNDYMARFEEPPFSWKDRSVLPKRLRTDFLNAIANNQAADQATRAMAVFTLFGRKIQPGASAVEVHRAMKGVQWLGDSELRAVHGIGGWAPLEVGVFEDTMFSLSLFQLDKAKHWSPWNIYFRLTGGGNRTGRDARSFFEGDSNLGGSPKLAEYALCYPDGFEGKFMLIERFGVKGIHVYQYR
jgi:TPR repeat protein